MFWGVIDAAPAWRQGTSDMPLRPDPSPAEALLARETQLRYGRVPTELDGVKVAEDGHFLSGDAYLLRSDGLSILYRKGEGVTVEHGPDADISAESLWLNGSVYAAIASINGFKPIHASAVAYQGQVVAFTGPSGAGKSTLIAALGKLGLPMFCDDTLVLDLSDPARIICLPGHKRLKLTPEALALTGTEGQEKVGVTIDKFYALPPSGEVGEPLPLGRLVFLEDGPDLAAREITGADRFTRLSNDHYTEALFASARRLDRAAQFVLQARLAQQIPMTQLTRPRDRLQFAASALLAAKLVRNEEKSA